MRCKYGTAMLKAWDTKVSMTCLNISLIIFLKEDKRI